MSTCGTVTAERLHKAFAYDPQTGLFKYKLRLARRVQVGANTSQVVDSTGYLRICIDSQQYRAHRLAWLYVHETWPIHEIDHINGVRHDNRIANLRDVPRLVNSQNTRQAISTNKAGLQGVWSPSGTTKHFQSYIIAGGIRHRIGLFYSADAAHEAYLQAKRELHVGCTI